MQSGLERLLPMFALVLPLRPTALSQRQVSAMHTRSRTPVSACRAFKLAGALREAHFSAFLPPQNVCMRILACALFLSGSTCSGSFANCARQYSQLGRRSRRMGRAGRTFSSASPHRLSRWDSISCIAERKEIMVSFVLVCGRLWWFFW